MHQVGEEITFELTVSPSAASGIYSYVWEWWDGTVTATTQPRATKRLNMGGDPNNGRKLFYTVRPVMEDGQSVVITGEIVVNNPPFVVPSPTVSTNDQFFPFVTRVELTAYDVENDGLAFTYLDSAGTIIGQGTSSYVGLVDGTWNGTYGLYAGTNNFFYGTIQSNQNVRLEIVDSMQGTRAVTFQFFGQTAPPPVVGVTADPDVITADATTLPDQRIGPGQTITFNVYAADQQSNDFDFLWSFYGSNGWAVNEFSTGTEAVQPDGSVRNTYIKSIQSETGGQKRVLIRVTSPTSGLYSELPITVNLIANTVATTGTLEIFDQNGTPKVAGDSVPVGTRLDYRATVVDPQGDIVEYKWIFSQPGTVVPTTLRLWGRDVLLDTAQYPSGSQVIATLVAYDRMLGSTSFSVPVINVA